MPIPMNDQKEFSIQRNRRFQIRAINGQAIQWNIVPRINGDFLPVIGTARRLRRSRLSLRNFVVPSHFQRIINFISQMKQILKKIHDPFNLSGTNEFENILIDFALARNTSEYIAFISDFYSDLSNNNRIRALLGENLGEIFRNKVWEYYNMLLERKEKRKTKKTINMKFKEFKVHQHYFGRKAKNEILRKNKVIKYFNNQHKYRKLRLLRRAI